MSLEKEEKFEDKILECLLSNGYGLTVAEIARLINASRNTVYRYLGILEAKDIVFRKEIGNYNLYFSKEGRQISRDIVASFYTGLLIALSKELSNLPSKFKEIGKIISNYVVLPFDAQTLNQFGASKEFIKKEFVEVLGILRPYISLLHDRIVLKDILVEENAKRIVLHFVNSDMLQEHEEGINHFYLLTGFIEAKIKLLFNLTVKCDILNYQISKEKKENFIKFSLELI